MLKGIKSNGDDDGTFIIIIIIIYYYTVLECKWEEEGYACAVLCFALPVDLNSMFVECKTNRSIGWESADSQING